MTDKQTEALKLALEALECDPLDMALNPDGHMGFRKDQAITAIREALTEQPAQQQEPAQGCEFCSHPLYAGTKCKNCGREQPAIKQDLTPEQPAQRKPLTDEEIMNLCASEWASHPIEVARVIEAAHGIGEKPDAA